MKQMRDFICNRCGYVQERFIEDEIEQYPCECGGMMVRIISTPSIRLEGITGAFPGAYDRWARVREERARIAAKRNRED